MSDDKQHEGVVYQEIARLAREIASDVRARSKLDDAAALAVAEKTELLRYMLNRWPYRRECVFCGTRFVPTRDTARTCSTNCRVRLHHTKEATDG